MRIPDEQLALFEQRLQALGLGRRDFLKAVGAMAAFGGLGFATRAEAAKPFKLGPGEKLAKEQVLRLGGGGFWQNDPSSHDYNKDLYCAGVPIQFAGLMNFNADFVAEPYLATKVQSNKDGSVWTFTIRKDSRWSDNSPVSARDFEWSWKRQLDPESKAPYAAFLYDIKNGEAFNKKQVTNRDEVGVKAKDDSTLEVALDGPRGYFPVLPACLAALPAHRGAVEKHGDKWTEAGNIVTNGPFVMEQWEHNKQMVFRKSPHFFGAKDVHLDRAIVPIIPVQAGALPYENNELDLPRLQPGDLRKLQGDPRMQRDVFQYPYPGTWYLLPQVTKPPFDNVKVRRAVAHAVDRENVVKVSQGRAIPAWFMDYPDPHNEYFDTFYGKKTTGKRQAWANEAFDKELEAGRDTRDPKKRLEHYKKAEEIMQMDVGFVPVAWGVGFVAAKPWVKGIEKKTQGQNVIDGNIYVDMMRHIYIIERG